MRWLRKALAWHTRVRYGYLAPSIPGRVRCSLDDSVLFGEIYAEDGSRVQVIVEGSALITLYVGPGAWKVEPA
jgi:hypothetical protein